MPTDFSCCGRELLFSGDFASAKDMASSVLERFRRYDYVVACGCGCVAYMKTYFDSLFADTTYRNIYSGFLDKLYEMSDFLVNVAHYRPQGLAFPYRVVFVDDGMSHFGLRIYHEPRSLLQCLDGIELVEPDQPDDCCASGDLFTSVFQPVSDIMTASKVDSALRAGAQYVVSNEMDCLRRMSEYAKKHKLNLHCLHLADLLAGDF